MTSRFFLTAFFIISARLVAQIPTIVIPEMLEGTQQIYFDSLLQPVQKETSSYYLLTFFHRGKDVWSLDHNWRRKAKLVWIGVAPGIIGSPVALQGEARWLTGKEERLLAAEHFENGHCSGKTIRYDSKQRPAFIYDYEKKYQSEWWSYYYEKYEGGKLSKASFDWYNIAEHKWQTVCTEGCYVSKDLRQ